MGLMLLIAVPVLAKPAKTIYCPQGAEAPACIGTDKPETIYGWRGVDDIGARGGDDYVYAGQGRIDAVRGGNGNDRLWGQQGDDNLLGQDGNDRLYGGPLHDKILTGGGHDMVKAGEGNDEINVLGGGKDYVGCGAGDDLAEVDSSDKVNDCERVHHK